MVDFFLDKFVKNVIVFNECTIIVFLLELMLYKSSCTSWVSVVVYGPLANDLASDNRVDHGGHYTLNKKFNLL